VGSDPGHTAGGALVPKSIGERRTAMSNTRIDWAGLALAATGVALLIADYVTDLWGWY
jgi:hypothetical protein